MIAVPGKAQAFAVYIYIYIVCVCQLYVYIYIYHLLIYIYIYMGEPLLLILLERYHQVNDAAHPAVEQCVTGVLSSRGSGTSGNGSGKSEPFPAIQHIQHVPLYFRFRLQTCFRVCAVYLGYLRI